MGLGLADLGYLTDRPGQPCPKPRTRLQETMDERQLTKIDEKAFRAEVWRRDAGQCRCCLRKVIKTLARVPEQGHVHHCHGRTGDLRYEDKAAILVCKLCHERLTGRINERRLFAIATETFTIRQGTFTDARYPIIFRETP